MPSLKTAALFIFFLIFSVNTLSLANSSYTYRDCFKGETQCQKAKQKRMDQDKKAYQKWCKQHPKQCAKDKKMF